MNFENSPEGRADYSKAFRRAVSAVVSPFRPRGFWRIGPILHWKTTRLTKLTPKSSALLDSSGTAVPLVTRMENDLITVTNVSPSAPSIDNVAGSFVPNSNPYRPGAVEEKISAVKRTPVTLPPLFASEKSTG